MQSVAELLREALQAADAEGRVQIRIRHLPNDAASDLVRQTYEYVLAHADVTSADGWLVFREGIEGWWRETADLPDGEFGRLFHLRTDVVKNLTEQGLAYRRNPQSTLLYARREASSS